MKLPRSPAHSLDVQYVIAVVVVIASCKTSSTDPGPSAQLIGSNAVTAAPDASSAPVGSNTPSTPSTPSTPTQAAPRLELRTGEKLHEPRVETVWNIPGGTVTATVIDVMPSNTADRPITKLVVWGNGKRYDIVKTVAACDAEAELRHVIDSRIVFHCAIAPVDDEPEARIDDWLIRWSEETARPLRKRHWRGDPADSEPAWASPPRPTTANKRKQLAPDRRCCCEATMEDITTHGWEQPSDCKADPDNEVSATCVVRSKCQGINAD